MTNEAIPAEAVEAASSEQPIGAVKMSSQTDSRKSRTWVWWVVALMPVIPFVLWGLWLFATNDAVMFMVIIAALVGICAGGTMYANGPTK